MMFGYRTMFEQELALYFLFRSILAIILIIISFFASKKWAIIIDFMPAVLLAYTALNNLVIIYSGQMDAEEESYHALVSHFTLNIYFSYYVLRLNSNYFIS
jgi:hypothetical protein